MHGPRRAIFLLASSTLLAATGCVHRTVTVTSEPSGALVYLNDQEVGRTPMTREVNWYGTYAVELRKEGYQTLKTKSNILPPWWNWIPLDLITDCLPLTDHHELTFGLQPQPTPDPAALVARGLELQTQLESSEFTKRRAPTSRPVASSKAKTRVADGG